MRTESFPELTKKSWNRMVSILFRPFAWRKWVTLIFIAWLAGALGGGGSYRGTQSVPKRPSPNQQTASETSAKTAADLSQQKDIVESPGSSAPETAKQASKVSAIANVVLIILAILLISFIVLMTWLSCRFIFIWIHSILSNSTAIKEPFAVFKSQGDSYFKAILVFGAINLGIFSMLGLWIYFIMRHAGALQPGFVWSVGIVLKLFAPAILISILFIIVLSFIGSMMRNFTASFMFLDKSLFWPAWIKTWNLWSQHFGDMIKYCLFRFLLGIAAGVAGIILVLIMLIPILILAGIIFGILYLLFMIILKAKVLFMIAAILISLPVILASFFIICGVYLPGAAFLASFPFYFLSSLDSSYQIPEV